MLILYDFAGLLGSDKKQNTSYDSTRGVSILIVAFPDHTHLLYEGGAVQIGCVTEIDLECST